MDNQHKLFNTLWEHPENEVVEFKKAENDYSFEKLGKYFSALSNEANLRGKSCAWIIFGVWDKTHQITGSSFKNDEASLHKLKHDLAQQVTDGMTFRNIYELSVDGKRVIMFEIPAAPRNIIVKFKGVPYARDGESLVTLNQDKSDTIRFQSPQPDWSAELVDNASIEDLDELALATARIMFKKAHASAIPAIEIDEWTTEEFLGHSEMMRDGKLTRAAILLLGRPMALQKIHPTNAQITWIWRDKDGEVVDYEHFTIPYILSVDKIFGKIRNKTMRELPGGTLFPDTMKQYEDYSVREALHNCIVHQDYSLESRILVEGKAPRYNIALSVARKAQQVGHYTKETGLNKTAMVKLVLQLADNAGSSGFKRAMAFEILEQSLPAGMSKSQKLNFLTHLLMEINERGFIVKSESGKSWIITEDGKKYLNS